MLYIEPPKALILAKFDNEIEVLDILPKGSPFKVDPDILARSFPLSATGGEVVIFKYDESWISSITLKIQSSPRPLLASIIAIYSSREPAVSSVVKFLDLYDKLMEVGEIVLDRVKDLLPSIAKTLAGSNKELDTRFKALRSEGSKIVKKGYLFFVGGG